MANEIVKPNDIFVSVLMNPNASAVDLARNGLNTENTGLLSKDFYENNKKVKLMFTDEKGVFNKEVFDKVYAVAQKNFDDLDIIKTYNDLERYNEYNENDLYAPLNSSKLQKQVDFIKTINPLKVSQGVKALHAAGESPYSIRELAQLSKIWDTENQRWMDKTANELGILGTIFSLPLVYAQWDEDGIHKDPLTGKMIRHKKGDWKLNDEGEYYTETIGKRSGYGKQFVAASDTLTKEGTWLNKIDFFDSDDKEKSTFGTAMKTLVLIAPYLIPKVNLIYGGIAAAGQLGRNLPAFAKMLEGIAIGGNKDKETSFTRGMNTIENYFTKFDHSYSDKDQNSNWSFGKIATTIGDISGQLYQMRAMASLSNLVYKPKFTRTHVKLSSETLETLSKNYYKAKAKYGDKIGDFRSYWEASIQNHPEMVLLMRQQSKLAKNLSLGYMAVTSSADVYGDALAGGYDRRMAGFAGIAAAVGQMAIMKHNRLGDWFLDATVGYSDIAAKKAVKEAVRTKYEELAKATKELATAATKEEKIGIFARAMNSTGKAIKNVFMGMSDGTRPMLMNATREAIEEMTEEAVMDVTKGMFDFLTWTGLGNNPEASFGVAEDFMSGNFLERYALNAFGGFIGGGLFELLLNKIEPWVAAKIHGEQPKEFKTSIVLELMYGRKQLLLLEVHDLCANDNQIVVTDSGKETTTEGRTTRGLLLEKQLTEYINVIDGLIGNEERVKIDEEGPFLLTGRDVLIAPILEQSGIVERIKDDYINLVTDIVDLRAALEIKKAEEAPKTTEEAKKEEEEVRKKEKEDKKKKKEEKKEESKPREIPENLKTLSKEELLSLLTEKEKELEEFKEGKKTVDYLKLALAYLNTDIRGALSMLTLSDFVLGKYGKDLETLQRDGKTLEELQKEYEEWKKDEDVERRFQMMHVKTLDEFSKKFSKSIKDYVDTHYNDLRNLSIKKVLSYLSVKYGESLTGENFYTFVKNVAEDLKREGLPVFSISDVLQLDKDKVRKAVDIIFDSRSTEGNKNRNKLKVYTSLSGVTEEEVRDEIATILTLQLEAIPADLWSHEAVLGIIQSIAKVYSLKAIETLKAELGDKITLEALNNKLYSLGIDPFTAEEAGVKVETLEDGTVVTDNIVDLAVVEDKFRALLVSLSDPIELGLNSSMLEAYIDSLDEIDGEVVRNFKKSQINAISNKINLLEEYLDLEKISATIEYEDGLSDKVSIRNILAKDKKVLLDLLIPRLVSGMTPKEAIEDMFLKDTDKLKNLTFISDSVTWLTSITIELKSLGEFGPEIKDHHGWMDLNYSEVEQKFLEMLKSELLSKIAVTPYDSIIAKASKKPSKLNPIYELLRNIHFELFNGEKDSILNVLEKEGDRIQNLSDLAAYLSPKHTKVQLENAKTELNILKALIYSSNGGNIDEDNLFGYNLQIRNYLDSHGLKGAEDYNVITIQDMNLMLNDIKLIENKIDALLNIDSNNSGAKIAEDSRIKASYCKTMVEELSKKCSKLTIHGVSIAIPEDKLSELESDELKLAYIEKTLYENFHREVKDLKSDLKEVMSQLSIDLNYVAANKCTPSRLSDGYKEATASDKYVWLATTLGSHVNEYFYYKGERLKDTKSNKVPFFTLEIGEKIVYSYLNDSHGVHNALFDLLSEAAGTEEIPGGLMFVNGVTGAGKTDAIGGGSLSLLLDGSTILVSAPNENQANNFADSIKLQYDPAKIKVAGKRDILTLFITEDDLKLFEAELALQLSSGFKRTDNEWFGHDSKTLKFYFKKDKIHELLKNKKFVKPSDIIVIDEATHFNAFEIQLLAEAAKLYDIKIVLFGDSTLNGQSVFDDYGSWTDIFNFKTPQLTLSIRSNNNLKRENLEALSTAMGKYADELLITTSDIAEVNTTNWLLDNPLFISYYEDDVALTGDKFVEDLSTCDKDLEKILKLYRLEKAKDPSKNDKIIIIADLKDDGNLPDGLLAQLSKLGFSKDEYDVRSPEGYNSKAVQGAEGKYVIIDSFGKDFNRLSIPEKIKSVYTLLNRSSIATLAKLPKDILLLLNIILKLDKFTSIDELPQLLRRDELKQNRLKEIEAILNGWRPVKKSIKEPIVEPTTTKDDSVSPETSSEEIPDEIKDLVEDAEDYDPEIIESTKGSTTTDGEEKPRPITTGLVTTDLFIYPFLTRLGLEYDESTKSYKPTPKDKVSTSIDLEGLLNPDDIVTEQVLRGFAKFKNFIGLVLSQNLAGRSITNAKSTLAKYYTNDIDIAKFIFNIDPEYFSGIDIEDSSKLIEYGQKWLSELSIEDNGNLYVYGKLIDPKYDTPLSVKDDNTASRKGLLILYYGVKIKSKSQKVHLFITLGVLPDPTKANADKYTAIWDLINHEVNKNPKDTIVYKLNNITLSDIQKVNSDWRSWVGLRSGTFLTLEELSKSGAYFDRNLILVDRKLVEIDGKLHYRSLVYMAIRNILNNLIYKKGANDKATFMNELSRLEELFTIDVDGKKELKIKGCYITEIGYNPQERRLIVIYPNKCNVQEAIDYTYNRVRTDSFNHKEVTRYTGAYYLNWLTTYILSEVSSDPDGNTKILFNKDGSIRSKDELLRYLNAIKAYATPFDLTALTIIINNIDKINSKTDLLNALTGKHPSLKTNGAKTLFAAVVKVLLVKDPIINRYRIKTLDGKDANCFRILLEPISKSLPRYRLPIKESKRNPLIQNILYDDGSGNALIIPDLGEFALALIKYHEYRMLGIPDYIFEPPIMQLPVSKLSITNGTISPKLDKLDVNWSAKSAADFSWINKPEGFDKKSVILKRPDNYKIDPTYSSYILSSSAIIDNISDTGRDVIVNVNGVELNLGKEDSSWIWYGDSSTRRMKSIINSYGYDIRQGDVVQLWNSTHKVKLGEYTPEGKFKIIEIDGKSIGEGFEIYPDAVTHIYERTVARIEDIKKDFYLKSKLFAEGDIDTNSKTPFNSITVNIEDFNPNYFDPVARKYSSIYGRFEENNIFYAIEFKDPKDGLFKYYLAGDLITFSDIVNLLKTKNIDKFTIVRFFKSRDLLLGSTDKIELALEECRKNPSDNRIAKIVLLKSVKSTKEFSGIKPKGYTFDLYDENGKIIANDCKIMDYLLDSTGDNYLVKLKKGERPILVSVKDFDEMIGISVFGVDEQKLLKDFLESVKKKKKPIIEEIAQENPKESTDTGTISTEVTEEIQELPNPIAEKSDFILKVESGMFGQIDLELLFKTADMDEDTISEYKDLLLKYSENNLVLRFILDSIINLHPIDDDLLEDIKNILSAIDVNKIDLTLPIIIYMENGLEYNPETYTFEYNDNYDGCDRFNEDLTMDICKLRDSEIDNSTFDTAILDAENPFIEKYYIACK